MEIACNQVKSKKVKGKKGERPEKALSLIIGGFSGKTPGTRRRRFDQKRWRD